ncbi:octaprenyl diphosphate synthase [Microbulbifer thermotolerans]|uniref:Octaprenyl diphosphate synthase n=1 Tax=Microbulbifer thermotolerans TaxID=252514 RepID=A0A143HIT0_MICTH|nr:octaprenyl diphosphate synthase [Microbulbifer thermotolerans]AMX01625.1 octaprenyl diphosphate synthase [Microbulbifer thermotolerans]MCX2795945.1 octaprenyl diphosphate synthase [Microbulbifer thermotolerans]MCX2832502.1 octaprenyl diphosphate synthase [Microbulbifer thermotolerans]MCX2835634.1 octaprenyl diphosphate synthase [Microbulbifer thermotolerans]MCX2842685.1 octaprenyl diphosphate synthase [Microbulbifer thermotolerans]
MLPFHRAAADDFAAVNQRILDQLHSDVPLVENIGHYLVEAGGKRLRPLLVLLCARAVGYKGADHIDLAAIIEFIHTATLLHDDVVDTSDRRRGRLTANAKWGNAPAVLVGDFLYSRAFQMMVALQNMKIMAILSETTNTIAEGEVQQLVNAGDPAVSEENYFTVIHKKTGALFEAACETAAVLAGCPPQQREALKHYGRALGLAFQLVDDALDYRGNPEELGKNVGDDLAEGKPTLPLIYTMANGSKAQAALVREAIEQRSSAKLAEIVEAIESCGALEYTMERARAAADEAKNRLAFLPEGDQKTALLQLASFAVERST